MLWSQICGLDPPTKTVVLKKLDSALILRLAWVGVSVVGVALLGEVERMTLVNGLRASFLLARYLM